MPYRGRDYYQATPGTCLLTSRQVIVQRPGQASQVDSFLGFAVERLRTPVFIDLCKESQKISLHICNSRGTES
jgi:hypothetical protein